MSPISSGATGGRIVDPAELAAEGRESLRRRIGSAAPTPANGRSPWPLVEG